MAFLAPLALALGAACAGELPELGAVLDASPPPASVEEFLSHYLLPAEYRTNVTLVKRSASLQPSTDREPRALMENEDGSLTLSFIGHPDPEGDGGEVGYNDIEILRFDKAAGEYSLYSVHFAGGKPKIDGPNPERCMTCHFGPAPNPRPAPPWTPLELDSFVREKCAGKGPRGKAELGYGRYSRLDCRALEKRNVSADPMSALNRKHAVLDRIKFVARMRALPDYPKAKFAIAAALAGCEGLPDYVDYGSWRRRQRDYSEAVDRLMNTMEKKAAPEFASVDEAVRFGAFQRRACGGLTFVLKPLGVDFHSLGLSSLSEYRETSVVDLLEALAARDEELSRLGTPSVELRRASALAPGGSVPGDAARLKAYCAALLAAGARASRR